MIALSVLASGSSGNATIVRGPRDGGLLLLDAGLSPRETSARLAPLGLDLGDVTDILLTHLDHDHCQPGWAKELQQRPRRVHVHVRHRPAAVKRGIPVPLLHAFDESPDAPGGMTAHAMPAPHDTLGSSVFVLEHDGARLGWATDLGRVTGKLLEGLRGVDAIGIESNYDRNRQLFSRRPASLKRRIMGGQGHLSNEQSLEAVMQLGGASGPRHILLLHLSRECNSPGMIKDLYRRRAPDLVDRLIFAEQRTPTPMVVVRPSGHVRAEQMPLFG
ncbi:MAG: MBL fold metallo-hydrolase [Planctomycetota bacterium]